MQLVEVDAGWSQLTARRPAVPVGLVGPGLEAPLDEDTLQATSQIEDLQARVTRFWNAERNHDRRAGWVRPILIKIRAPPRVPRWTYGKSPVEIEYDRN